MNISLFFFLAKMGNFGHSVKTIVRQIDLNSRLSRSNS